MKEKGAKKRFLRSPQLRVDPENVSQHLRISDLRDLIFWCYGVQSIAHAPKWIAVENKAGIEHVVSLYVPNLPVDLLSGPLELENPKPQPPNPERLGSLKFFEYGFPTRTPGKREHIDRPEWAFARAPLTKTESKADINNKKKLRAKNGSANVPLAELKMTTQDYEQTMRYKLEAPNDLWVTVSPKISEQQGRAFAVDCEMCMAASGTVLTRVSVVDQDLKCVYSTFVQPDEPIIDYVTQFSGITPELLEGVTTTLKDVQQWFKENLQEGDMLVGHSLECDLEALKMVHLDIIDTSVIFPHPRGVQFRHALRFLTKKYLKREIQGAASGHDPTEDATACMELLKLKQEKGADYGLPTPTSSTTKRLLEVEKKSCIIDYGVPNWDPQQVAQTVISVASDDEAVTKVLQQVSKHEFVWARLGALEQLANTGADAETQAQALAATDALLAKLIEELPPRSMLILWSGKGDDADYRALQKRKKTWLADYESKNLEDIEHKWTSADDEALVAAANKARLGLSFIGIKEGVKEPSAKKARTE